MPETTQFDCVSCGACCAPAENWLTYVEVTSRDYSRLPLRYRLRVLNGELPLRERDGARRCIALRGQLGEKVACDIYRLRPDACRRFEAGSPHCHAARREILGVPLPVRAAPEMV